MHDLITEIQSLGIHIHDDLAGRKGGAGPAEGRAFMINGIPVSAPIAANYVKNSPFSIKETDSGFDLLKHNIPVSPIQIVPEPQFYNQATEDGIPYKKIALLHGKDCLATTVMQKCIHWKHARKCSFCSTESSLSSGQTIAKKTALQLAQVARAARDLDGVTHMVLTSGTGDPPGSEISYLAQCARAIKKAANIPMQVQIAPPKDLGMIDELKDAGVESIGIHIESFDTDILSKVAPAKAKIGLTHYEKAWKKAVQLFGVNQVSSFIIAGLGETKTSIAWGSELLADIGVYPFVVPLRPIPGSQLANATPPDPDIMKQLYNVVGKILQTKGISTDKIVAGCARCGACSALSSYETFDDTFDETCCKTACGKPKKRIVFHTARNKFEKSRAFCIRKKIFVREQQLFDTSDIDENDSDSIHLVAKQEEKIIGTVRIYKEKAETDHWIGGRLAVEKEFRNTSAGSGLVKEAMKRVKKKGAKLFTAHIQEKNIPFFLQLGWTPLGTVKSHFGRLHLKMEADLNTVPEDMQI